jgi:hypothetical protein
MTGATWWRRIVSTPYAVLHLKDYRIASFQMPEDRSTFLAAFHGLIEFAEVDEGNLPIASCIDAGVAGGL